MAPPGSPVLCVGETDVSATSQPVFRFALVGLSNTVVGFAAIWFALRQMGLGDIVANAIGYALGFAWGFLLNRNWTFGHRGRLDAGLFKYALVCVVAYAGNLVVLMFMVARFGRGSLTAQGLGIAAYSTLAYLGARYWAFPVSREGNRSW